MKHRYGGGSKSKSKGARLRPYIVLLTILKDKMNMHSTTIEDRSF